MRLDLSAMQEGEHFVCCCERFVLFINIFMQRIDDLIEAECHATLKVLAVICRSRRLGSGPEGIVDLP